MSCTTTPVPPVAVEQHDNGIAYLNAGQCDRAFAACTHALEYAPQFAHGYHCLGLIAMQCDGDLDKAARRFKQALAIDEDFVAARTNLGVTFLERTPPDLEQACELFESAIEIAPGAHPPRENLVRCQIRRQVAGEAETIEDAYLHARILRENRPLDPVVHELLGVVELERERVPEAARSFERCLELDVTNARCHYYRGHAYLAEGRCEAAVGKFLDALIAPNGSDIEIETRKDLERAGQCRLQFDRSLRDALDEVAKRPSDAIVRQRLAFVLERLGMLEAARVEWTLIAQLDQNLCEPHFHLAMAAHRELNTDELRSRCDVYVRCEGAAATKKARCAELSQAM